MNEQKGFSLVEILVALLLLGFGLVAMFNLIPLGLQSLTYSHRLNETALLAEKKLEEFKSTHPLVMGTTSGTDGLLSWSLTASPLSFPVGIKVVFVELDVAFVYQQSPQHQRFVTYMAPDQS
jgi:prepilin-type N-terminal cleavage/methylation domain-containing protein